MRFTALDPASPVAAANQSVPPPDHNGNGTPAGQKSLTGNALIDGLLYGNAGYANYWTGTVTFSFPDAPSDYGSYISDANQNGLSAQYEGFSQISGNQIHAVRFALDADTTLNSAAKGFSVEGFTNLNVVFSPFSDGNATMRIANSSDAGTAYAYRPGSSIYSGDIFLGTDSSIRYPTEGTYGWFTAIHEIGHALGLKHGHDGDAFAGNGTVLPSAVDAMEYSVMTYRSYPGAPTDYVYNEPYGFAQTFMMLDIQALQYLYGADFTTNADDSVYAWTPSGDQTFINGDVALAPAANRIFATIWDGGGNDTYDLSAYTTNLRISLTPGESSLFSSAQVAYLGNGHYASGNIYNALQYQGDARSLIENAIGGGGSDLLRGNVATNRLEGGGGHDNIYGLEGNDTLIGGDGNDNLDGGAGGDAFYGGAAFDYAWYSEAGSSIVADLASIFQGTGDATADTFYGVEGLVGSNFDDMLLGDALSNTIIGNEGADSLYGRGQSDTLIGGDGNDYLDGGVGPDALFGGAGFDYAMYSNAASGVLADLLGHYANTWEAAGDTFDLIDGLSGSRYDDTLLGDHWSNTLVGHEGVDNLYGRRLNDTLVGGDGNDHLDGGEGADALYGGGGFDLAWYSSGTSGVWVDLGGVLTFTGEAAGDTLDLMDGLVGSQYDDILWGDGWSNTLVGGGGADILDGGGLNDTLYGSGGTDIFIFAPHRGFDVVVDFEDDVDDIDLRSFGFSSASQALDYAEVAAEDVVFQFGSDMSLVVRNVSNIADLENDILI